MEHGPEPGRGGGVSAKRRLTLLPARRGDPRASVAAFVLQLAIIAIIVPSLIVPIAFEVLRDDAGRAVMPERISFVTAVPQRTSPSREAPRAGGDGRTPSETPAEAPAAPIVAPREVPTGIPEAPTGPVRPDPGGVGPLIGGGGPTQGIRPSFNDPRLWQTPAEVVEAPVIPMTRADSLQALLHATAEAYVDSLRRVGPAGRTPGDWTIERNGKKYGVDQRYIQLGDFKIPTALLALLPMNVQGNPQELERGRRLMQVRNEIMAQADRRTRDDDFYAAVRALRERKERERREAQQAAEQAGKTPDR